MRFFDWVLGPTRALAPPIFYRYAGVFERLERASPEDRRELFYRFESRWCWDCGEVQSACECDALAMGHPTNAGEG